jgi:magnesium transporter
VFVIDAERRLRGILSIKQLLLASPSEIVRDVMSRDTVHVTPEESLQSIARMILRYNLTSVPVVDGAGRLLGRVTAADAGNVTVDDAAGELLRFGGVSVREAVDARWPAAVRSRLPWLYTNLLPAFGAAAVVYFFKGSLLRIVTLAVWMPVVGGVGGNAGTQALAASVRRLILQSGRAPKLRTILAREAATGIVNGVGIGAVVGAVSVLVGESWKLGLVVSIAMTANLVLAAVAGAATPFVLKRLGRDPALASPVLLTALTDATGFAILLGLASAVLL